MEFTPELITELGLSEEQVPKLKEAITNHVADLKKDWDGKANTDAEGIISGAINSAKTKFGLSGDDFDRKTGEKYAEFLGRVTPSIIESALAKEKGSLIQKQQELDRKLKEGGGDAALKLELETVKGDLDKLKQKEAQFADWEKNDYKGKYEAATQQMSSMELRVAFSNVKPSFPDSVNQYEAKAKWDEFQKNITTTYNIKLNEEGEAIAVDKTNEYKTLKLVDLVKNDKTISELSKGRVVTGLGSGNKQNIKIEGVPFDIPENATSEERNKSIKEYLTATLGLAITSPEYAKKFAEFNTKLLEKNPKK